VTILFIGRVVFKKGIHTLIRALHYLRNDLKANFVVIIAGPQDKMYYSEMLQLAAELGVTDLLIWKDALVGQEKYDQILNCSFFISPSVSDLHPITLMEAQALGRAVISTKVGLIPEIVRDKETGLLVDPENPEELSQAIKSLVLNQDLRRKMGEKALKLMSERCLLEDTIDKLELLYLHCLSQ